MEKQQNDQAWKEEDEDDDDEMIEIISPLEAVYMIFEHLLQTDITTAEKIQTLFFERRQVAGHVIVSLLQNENDGMLSNEKTQELAAGIFWKQELLEPVRIGVVYETDHDHDQNEKNKKNKKNKKKDKQTKIIFRNETVHISITANFDQDVPSFNRDLILTLEQTQADNDPWNSLVTQLGGGVGGLFLLTDDGLLLKGEKLSE